jgi:aminoglycoside 6-adenylyltransferase
MLELIVDTAKRDDRIRAVVMNVSRAVLTTPRDIFQDFDIVYMVTDVASFRNDPSWVDRFGARMIPPTTD